MGRARQTILYDDCLAHITFKCHNSSFYFKPDEVKEELIKIVAKNKKRFNIPIFDWVFMSNHPHFIVYIRNISTFSNFMRQTNREIASLINKRLNKTGQVIQDRFKSPVIESEQYLVNTISYIWLNPVRARIVNLKQAHRYKFCSLYYKYRGIKDPISDSYSLLKKLIGYSPCLTACEQKFCVDQLNALISKELSQLSSVIYEHSHSIGSKLFIKSRIKANIHSLTPREPP